MVLNATEHLSLLSCPLWWFPPTAATLFSFLHLRSLKLCAMKLCHWYASTLGGGLYAIWNGMRGAHGELLVVQTAPCVPRGWLPRLTEERGVLTMNSPDTGMRGAVKCYTAPFIIAPAAQQGHGYWRFPPTRPAPQTHFSLLLVSCWVYFSPVSLLLTACHWYVCQRSSCFINRSN